MAKSFVKSLVDESLSSITPSNFDPHGLGGEAQRSGKAGGNEEEKTGHATINRNPPLA